MLAGLSLENPGQLGLTLMLGLAAAVLIVLVDRLFQNPTVPDAGTVPSTRADGLPERRQWPRQAGGSLALLLMDAEDPEQILEAILLDRSLGGLGVEVEDEVAVGRRFHVRPQEAAPEAPWALVEVIYCRRRGEHWRMGVQFVDASSWEIMNLFGPPEPEA